jgi:hypothetical protein
MRGLDFVRVTVALAVAIMPGTLADLVASIFAVA